MHFINTAPIALFVYNRPHHTQKTLEALRANEGAKQSDLIIFSDAPKTLAQEDSVAEVRKLISSINGFKSIRIVSRTENFGLARSILTGIQEVLSEFDRVIVLEDDLVTAPVFLKFMNKFLDIYANEPKVMHISGSIFPLKDPKVLPDVFFYRATSCWGWGTWKRAWNDMNPDGAHLLQTISSKGLEKSFDINGTYPYMKMLQEQVQGHVNSWAIRWYASVFLKEGLCLHPRFSLVENIGHDGSGVHCIPTSVFTTKLAKTDHLHMMGVDQLFVENAQALRQIEQFFIAQRPSFGKRLLNRIRRVF